MTSKKSKRGAQEYSAQLKNQVHILSLPNVLLLATCAIVWKAVIMELIIASTNKHKLNEFSTLISQTHVRSVGEYGDFAVVEDGNTFMENAFKKAFECYKISKTPSLSDDSGLEVDALDGAPGIYSARYGSESGHILTDSHRYEYLLAQMQGNPRRSCRFICCLVLVWNEHRIYTIQESCEGVLLNAPQGCNGFGYDPVFFLPELDKSMAELDLEQKNRVSHRGRAAKRMNAIIASILSDG